MRRYHRATRFDTILALLPSPFSKLDRADLFRTGDPPRPPGSGPVPVPLPVADRPPARPDPGR